MLTIEVVSNRFFDIAGGLASAIIRIVQQAAFNIVALAQGLVPVDTGFLRASIQAFVDGFIAVVAVAAEYAAYVEFGTSRMAAQPYLTPAVEHTRRMFEAELANLERAL